MSHQIALDGPAGAGKSTIAKLVAKELNFVYVDTGAMYRALGLYCLRNSIPVLEEEKVVKFCKDADVTIKYIDGEQAVLLNGENVNGYIRTPEVGNAASAVSVYREIREKLVYLQQRLTDTEDVIMDGRDIGSVVLPNADIKIYLDADVEVRAKRRFDELEGKGEKCDYETVLEEMKDRDYRDMHRENSPLTKAEDAVIIDSSHMGIEEVKDEIIKKYKEAVNG